MDDLAIFATASQPEQTTPPARFAIRQALDQEYQKYLVRQNAAARQARYLAGGLPGAQEHVDPLVHEGSETGNAPRTIVTTSKRDFFGRAISQTGTAVEDTSIIGEVSSLSQSAQNADKRKVWISFHEGFSNAVRKPITLDEMMRGF